MLKKKVFVNALKTFRFYWVNIIFIIETLYQIFRPPDKSAYWKTILFLIQNICCGYSKDGSFEHPKHMFKLIEKKIIQLYANFLLNWPNAYYLRLYFNSRRNVTCKTLTI